MGEISRKHMPQVDTENLPKAIKMISDDVRVVASKIAVGKLKKSQKELHKDKIIGISKKFKNLSDFKPLVISSDNYIVDGHHRWAAAIYKWGKDAVVPVVRIGLPKIKAITLFNRIADKLNQVRQESILKEVDVIPGGLAKGLTLKDVADTHNITLDELKPQASKGVKVEMEHTTDVKVAYEIVKDHLFEDPKYYDKLSTIESKKKSTNEVIEIPIEIGDTVLGGKFKNKKIVVKTIGKNEKGDITINGKPLLKFRLVSEGIDINEAQSKLKLNIPKNVLDIHNAFKKEGRKLYIVGGAVRDAILGQIPKDFDLATDAKPDDVLGIAKKYGFKSAEVGKQFGVVIINGEEIATFRKDIGKGRRPDAVDYTDIYGDVKRRDLTINALFYDIDRQQIVDLVGGIADLKNKFVRTVGKAEERFDEDALRKLRALRFMARIGGNIEKSTLQALQSDPSLVGVSAERIRDEFIKSIKSAKSPKSYLSMVDKLKMLQQILPNISYSKDFIDTNNPQLQIAYLLRKNQPTNVNKSLKKLKYTADEAYDIAFLVTLSKFKDQDVYKLKKMQANSKLSDSEIVEWGKLVGNDLSKFVKFNLSVSGNDVMKMGFKGKDVGDKIEKMEIDKFLNEMSKADIKQIDSFADKQMSPIDINLTGDHFFQRLNDPRNKKEITSAELIGFFKRLSRRKAEFVEFLNKYNQIVATDDKTKLNIPFLKKANSAIAKTVMRKNDFKTPNKKITIS